ncbi:MAG: glycosyltransferase [Chloroflexi bacterium]|nr:glycosyltransferase [Chloroflexota bacterium]
MNDVTFVLLSFEGPDGYSHAGGLGSRVTELASTLAGLDFKTHLFFIGDPDLPGYETRVGGRLHLHRWCQWISRHHLSGVYDGEEGKLWDWDRSVPPWLEREVMEPALADGGSVIVMGEEWHTANTMIALRHIVNRRGWSGQVRLLWNANNTFSFHRINWDALKASVHVTTVSRYMKHIMWGYGVNARVVPNGISESWLAPLEARHSAAFARLLRGRLSLAKVARFDPDKRWLTAVEALAQMKAQGLHPLLLARGGLESHKYEVVDRIRHLGLTITETQWQGSEPEVFAEALAPALSADVIDIRSFLSQPQRKVLYRSVDAVLANSGLEPFGLVGLETMASGGVAFVGCTGEDYATPGFDAIAIQTSDPREIAYNAAALYQSREASARMRQAARRTATRYTWQAVIKRALIPFLEETGVAFPSVAAFQQASSCTENDEGGTKNALPAIRAGAREELVREPALIAGRLIEAGLPS